MGRGDQMTNEEKLHTGDLYLPNDPKIILKQLRFLARLKRFNRISPARILTRQRMMKKMFAEIGKDCYIESPLYANMGAHNVHFGDHIYANFGLTLVDDTHIYVGSNTMFGPHVTVATAGHPVLPELRKEEYQFNLPVHIGENCWLGAGCIILPGVTIGDNTVIGAGSVVTKDIPANVVAFGNPCRVQREIGAYDREYYTKNRKIENSLSPDVWKK